MNPQHQNHLRTLRRGLNRAVAALKEGERLLVHSGWGHGFARSVGQAASGEPAWPEDAELYYLYPTPTESAEAFWSLPGSLLPAELIRAADFFWPGPLAVAVRCPATRRKVQLGCPWHPLLRELLARHGPCAWTPLTPEQERHLWDLRGRREIDTFQGCPALLWPDREVELPLTLFDASTRPWRWMETGFVSPEEFATKVAEPFLLSSERAFPTRPLRTFAPAYRTVVVEAAVREELPALVESFRQGIGPEWSLRIYLEEGTAHEHFPDDRSVRVYGEMGDPERVRRRLEAMLERQRRRSGKRILLIAVTELPPAADSLKADLRKLADRWILVPPGGKLELDEFAS